MKKSDYILIKFRIFVTLVSSTNMNLIALKSTILKSGSELAESTSVNGDKVSSTAGVAVLGPAVVCGTFFCDAFGFRFCFLV